jgi:hypothetical protein
MGLYTPEMIERACNSNQTEFENSNKLPDDDGVVFATAVPDAPLQVIGRLGRDGLWYIASYTVAPLHLDASGPLNEQNMPGTLILRSEPIADAMIRFGIGRMLNGRLASKKDMVPTLLARLKSCHPRFRTVSVRPDQQKPEQTLCKQLWDICQTFDAAHTNEVVQALAETLARILVQRAPSADEACLVIDLVVRCLKDEVHLNFPHENETQH